MILFNLRKHIEHSNLLQFDILLEEKNIEHFSTTRVGGVSGGTYASFNLGNFSDDSSLNITENRNILARMFYKDISDFIIPHQTHSSNVLNINDEFLNKNVGEKINILYNIDATLTNKIDLFLCVTTADCVPILLYDKKNKVIAAVHAGWRGVVGRILEKTIAKMKEVYNAQTEYMIACLGPSISMKNYEVGVEVVKAFLQNDFDLSKTSYRKNPSTKLHLDLKELNRLELIRLGIPVNQIEVSDYCTFDHEDLFFSARRQTVHSGRMLTGIMMK